MPPGSKPISFGEFLQFIGIWFAMATTIGFRQKDFWYDDARKLECHSRIPPYNFSYVMTAYRYNLIYSHLSFTTLPIPNFPDEFWEMRQLEEIWNKNMSEVFIPY